MQIASIHSGFSYIPYRCAREKVPNILAHLDCVTVDRHGSGIFKRAPCIRECEIPASYVELVERDDLQQRPRLREFLRAFLQVQNADGTGGAKGSVVCVVGQAMRCAIGPALSFATLFVL